MLTVRIIYNLALFSFVGTHTGVRPAEQNGNLIAAIAHYLPPDAPQ